MSWILEHLNIVIVAVLVIGSFLKSRFDTLNQGEEEPEELPDFEGYEESHRQSPPAMPYVPPAIERTQPTVRGGRSSERSSEPQPIFAATRSQSGAFTASAAEAASILEKQRDIQERMRAIRAARPTTHGSKAPSRPMTNARKPATVAVGGVPSSIRARLQNPAEVRRAVILREILDRPVGLR